MLADVEEGGTGKQALVPGMRICGKTGTAQVTDAHNNLIGHTVWFASYAAFENPRYAMVIMIEGDRGANLSGAATCAPIAAKIYRAIQKLEQQTRPSVAQNN